VQINTHSEPNTTKPNQPNQTKPNQVKPKQTTWKDVGKLVKKKGQSNKME
jgi:hypothetical protein